MSEIEDMWIDNPYVKLNDTDEYVNWFDSSENYRDNCAKGYIDFYNRILTLDMYKYLGDPKNKNCLEIGFGGGRLLNASSRIFDKSYGIDILNQECIAKTYDLLMSNGCNNVHLYNRKDVDQIEDESIDFVYSFIVFQHFSDWEMVEFYLDVIDRVLTDTGVGIIYFGRNDFNNDDVYIKEPEDRGCSLYVKSSFVEHRIGEWFDVIEVGEVTKQPWNDARSGQFYVKFIRQDFIVRFKVHLT